MSADIDEKNEQKVAQKEKDAKEKYKTPEKEHLAKIVKQRWEESSDALNKIRKDYQLNLAFYLGEQWIVWNSSKGSIEPLPPRISETERVRVTVNKIEPRIDTLLGVLTERDLVFEGDATDADDQSLRGAQVAEGVLESARMTNGWEGIRREAIMGLLFGGTSAIVYEWDRANGERLWVNPQNEKIIGTGEVRLTPLTIDQFSLETGSKDFHSANWWIGLVALTVDQARDRYGLDFTPEADLNNNNKTFSFERRYGDEASNLCAVYTMYERPNNKCKKGRCIVVINGMTIHESEWSFPFNNLNIRVFRQGVVPNRWYGKTFVTASRPVQVLYNAARSGIAEHMKQASNARLLVPYGSLDDPTGMTDEHGEILQYNADPNIPPPNYLQAPNVSNTLLEECERLERELDDILHAHDVARGVAPGDRNSGLALSILAEKNNTPLGPMTHDQADGWSAIGKGVLELYQENVKDKRKALITSASGVPQKWEWSGKDLRGQTNVRVPIDAVAPFTRAQMLAQLQNLQQLSPEAFQQLPKDRIVKLMQLSSAREMLEGMDPDVAKARRENDRMSIGEPEIPEQFDDHAKHIAEHNAFRKTKMYELAPQEVKNIVDDHVIAHEKMVQEELMGQASLNAIQPGLGALPQANDPMGSAVPPPMGMGNPAGLSESQPLPPGPPM